MTKDHFQANLLDWDNIEGTMLSAESVLEYIEEFYVLKESIAKDGINACRYNYNEWMGKILDVVEEYVLKNQQTIIED